jgi:hypothetical protein
MGRIVSARVRASAQSGVRCDHALYPPGRMQVLDQVCVATIQISIIYMVFLRP